MTEFAKEVLSVNLEDEMKRSYLDYAMSVIVGRALPDARDGLKPVHRRILFAQQQLNNVWNRPYIKCARVVGDVIGKYHPHGDTAAYDALVRMAQEFSMRYPLIDGQGNFGSVDGDLPAAMRYTECRMARLTSEMLADIDSETVDFVPNYDEKETEPSVLPARFPQLLVNGSSGIAVGMATNIPPHNLSEVLDACIALIDNPDLDLVTLMKLVPAPDFPTAGLIVDASGVVDAYTHGRGRIVLRARTHVEDFERGGERQAIIVTELPYQVNKSRLLQQIVDLVKDKRIEGIASDGLRDESDKEGMRVVIELRRGENVEVLLNNLYQHTQLQISFSMNMVALDGGQPKTLGLKALLEIFLRHRREVVTRRTQYLLRKARERAHVLEGLSVALANIDEVIALIRSSPGPAEAKAGLMGRIWNSGQVSAMLERAGADSSRPLELTAEFGLVDGGYRLSEAQAQAILELRLQRLTGLEQDKIHEEFRELLESILGYLEILGSEARLLEVIRQELLAIKEQYGDARRTEISEFALNLNREDLIAPQEMIVTLSHQGYVKSQPQSEYQVQHRGGRGKTAATTKDDDYVQGLWSAHTHDWLLCFSSRGRLYWLRVFELPAGAAGSRGKPFVNLLPLEEGERITTVLPVKSFDTGQYVFMATRRGTVKKTPLVDFSRPRAAGIIAVDLRVDDALVGVALTSGESDILLFSDAGRVIRFNEKGVRPMSRIATGVRGMRLIKAAAGEDEETAAGDVDAEAEPEVEAAAGASSAHVIALIVARQGDILTVSEQGYGKRTPIDGFPLRGRGGQGVIAQALSDKSGDLIGAVEVDDTHDIMLISDGGRLIRVAAKEIKTLGRNTQGVRVARPTDGDRLVSLDRMAPEAEAEEPGEPTDGTPESAPN
jgi:DNA gyrase subunit A